ncbi:MAG TPA: PHP domain-containing protein, partial [Clostridia bacterium]|nr:PHP domain-containing protein [Clostridia bacterium]
MIPALTGSGFEAGSGNSPGFRYFLQEITLPPILQAKIASARLKKVEVLVPSCHWRLFLKFSEAVPENEEFWQPLTEALLRHVPSLKGVSYQICYQLSGKNARFLLENFQEAFLQSIQVQAPFLAGWLEASRIEAVDEKLVFWLPSDLGRQFFLAKDARDMIKSILIDKFDWKGEVSLKVDERGDQSFFPGRDYAEKYLAGRLGISGRGNEARSKKKALTGERTLLGKNITQSPTAIIDILDEEKSVSIQGVILSLTSRELKNGRHLFLFDVTDVSDTITVKAFEPEKGWHQLPSLQEGDWILVQGQVQHDPYTRELTLVARNMNRVEPELRLDQAPEKRVELHLHTKMSALDAINNIDMVFKTAALWGHEAVAITDHGVVQAFPEAYEAGKRYGVKPIYGLEGYLFNEEEKKPRLYHVVILVKNQEGLENLYRLVTLSHLDYFYRKPRIPRSELVRLQKGLLLGSACEAGEVIQGYLAGKTHEELLHIADFYDYIEIQPLDNNEFMVRKGLVASLDELKTMNLELVELAKKLGKPVVATGDVHFLNPEDEIFRKVLHAGQGYADEEQAPLYFRTTEEM